MANNQNGMILGSSSNNILRGNSITANRNYGIWLFSSSNNTLAGNMMAGNTYNLGIEGSFMNYVDSSNTVNDKPVYYWINKQDMTVPSDAGFVALINCTHITVQNLELTGNEEGVLLVSTTNSTITENHISNNDQWGVKLGSSSNYNIVSGNNITSNSYIGVEVDSSSHDSFTGNSITANGQYGIFLDSSSYNTVSGNNVMSNGLILNEADGIALAVSSNNTVSDNNVTSNGGGISVTGGSSGNTVSGNNITGNNGYYNGLYGLLTYSSSGNKFYHNSIVHNMGQFLSHESVNVWDDGYPSGGNYWSDYNGTDFYSGPYQNITGSDGIGDSPYNNLDRYPLLTPFTTSNPDPQNGMEHSADVFSNSLLAYPASNAPVNERPESPCAEMRMCCVHADQERANKKTHAGVR